eukprot:scaffold2684_cov124-Isochrysis_galbana.AAC.11
MAHSGPGSQFELRLSGRGTEARHLVPNEISELFLGHVEFFESKREMFLHLREFTTLVEGLQILGIERLCHCAALVRVEVEHLFDQVQRKLIGIGEHLGPIPLWLRRKGTEKLHGLLLDDQAELVQIVATGQQRLARHHLSENAAACPDVNRSRIRLVLEQQLWSAVPARHDVLSEPHVFDLCTWVHRARQPKVANLQVTILVDQEIAWFQIAVQHMGRMERMDTAQDLVEEVLKMLFREWLFRVNDVVQVGIHQLCHDILQGRRWRGERGTRTVSAVCILRRPRARDAKDDGLASYHILPAIDSAEGGQNIDDPQDVGVLEVAQDLHLSQQTLAACPAQRHGLNRPARMPPDRPPCALHTLQLSQSASRRSCSAWCPAQSPHAHAQQRASLRRTLQPCLEGFWVAAG